MPEILERYRDLLDDWDAFIAAVHRPLAPCIWTNTLRITPQALAEWLARDGIAAQPADWYPGAFRLPPDLSPGRLLAHAAGLCHIQEEVSLLPVALLDPQPGDRLLDLCAAPGNKTIQAAVRMEDRGLVIANDVHRRRIGLIVQNLERLGITIGAVTVYSAGNLPREIGLFDRVLADVPCSCEGTARKSREVLYRKAKDPGWCRRAQSAILHKAFQRCRPGGRIVYSTCTYAPEENEMVVDELLRTAPPGSVRLRPARINGFRCAPGLREWEGTRLSHGMDRTMRVWPHHNDTGGFFVAVLERTAE
ncbi:MAG: RsmB/NOP family class I SAM-dependent RNA methyltransferase [bacterium]|nr:RsmB/NOP family class I SAM-dependent RNA methyltransferase [bacterium]